MISSKEIANEMEIKPKFHEKCIICRKNKFSENNNEERILSPKDSFRIDYFVYVIDQDISSISNRFKQFQFYENIFRFYLILKN